MIRGTLRYPQFPGFIKNLVSLGFLDDTPNPVFDTKSQSWAETLKLMLNAKSASKEDLVEAVAQKCGLSDGDPKALETLVDGMDWLNMFDSSVKITPKGNALDTLCATLEQKMLYGPGERDMIALQHKFVIEKADGTKEIRTSTLIEYGDPNKYTAMARLVGVPCGVASQQILDGQLARKGIVRPYDMQICKPLIMALKAENIELKEELHRLI